MPIGGNVSPHATDNARSSRSREAGFTLDRAPRSHADPRPPGRDRDPLLPQPDRQGRRRQGEGHGSGSADRHRGLRHGDDGHYTGATSRRSTTSRSRSPAACRWRSRTSRTRPTRSRSHPAPQQSSRSAGQRPARSPTSAVPRPPAAAPTTATGAERVLVRTSIQLIRECVVPADRRGGASQGRPPMPASEQTGFALVEVLVSAVLVVIIASGTLVAIQATQEPPPRSATARPPTGSPRRTRRGCARSASRRSPTTTRTRTVKADDGTYTVASRADFVTDSTGTASCEQNTASPDYIRITSTVTWPSIGARPPIAAPVDRRSAERGDRREPGSACDCGQGRGGPGHPEHRAQRDGRGHLLRQTARTVASSSATCRPATTRLRPTLPAMSTRTVSRPDR